MGGGKLCVRFHPSNIGVRFTNVSREFGQQLVLQTEFLALVVGFQHLQLGDLNVQLDVDEKSHEPEQDEEEQEDAPRPSVLAVLEEKSDKPEPVKPFRSYYDKDGDAR